MSDLSIEGLSVAMHVASRFALIAFATAALRGVLDGIDFQATTSEALKAAAVLGVVGVFVGEFARRLIEDAVRELVPQTLRDFASHLGLHSYEFRTRDVAAPAPESGGHR